MTTLFPSKAASAGPKLRNSCDQCAAAKVGCNKTKPSCGRCAKRGLSCVYGQSKRVGRIARKQQGMKSSADSPLASGSPEFLFDSIRDSEIASGRPDYSDLCSASADTAVSPEKLHLTQALHDDLPSSWGSAFDVIGSKEDLIPNLDAEFSLKELDEFFALGNYLTLNAEPELFPGTIPGGGDDMSTRSSSAFRAGSMASSSCDMGSNDRMGFSLFPNSSTASSPPNFSGSQLDSRTELALTTVSDLALKEEYTMDSLNGGLEGAQSAPSSLSCSCRVRSLGLLTQLTTGKPSKSLTKTSTIPSYMSSMTRAILAQNNQVMQEIREILGCSCCHGSNPYLLFILPIVIFELLSGYKSTAAFAFSKVKMTNLPNLSDEAALPRDAETDQTVDDTCGEDQSRIAAQLILSNLSSLQELIIMLCQRLHEAELSGCGWDNVQPEQHDYAGQSSEPSFESHGFTLPPSAELAHTLGQDMRRRVSELSRAIVKRLRSGWG